jgi:hypothetical protein
MLLAREGKGKFGGGFGWVGQNHLVAFNKHRGPIRRVCNRARPGFFMHSCKQILCEDSQSLLLKLKFHPPDPAHLDPTY